MFARDCIDADKFHMGISYRIDRITMSDGKEEKTHIMCVGLAWEARVGGRDQSTRFDFKCALGFTAKIKI